ncbi:pantoate--beta-alanine ligase [Phreatobacter aquaticus]|uniref:Pantothenate synthetase n=1 Tax=Phreatobacter aquaticus TaxID=2570229 RepID=A0A4D7QJ80_9HYPH|nr:pantoate--beta-alanine ligase [Phreatobacter aquaticus]QCK87720.1 pantoate--beta-alanine ligase [Phreatobacter aquaticus]
MAHPAPTIVRDVASLRALTAIYRAEGRPVALVPTMGALHAGHVSLVSMAQARGARVIVSIFVNPTQFGPSEDFSKYPRTFDSDLAKLAEAGADAVYAPTVEIMYPPGAATIVKVAGPATAGLDDVSRPFHFDGVATIVAKLFTQARPDLAIFGEKDFQQLAVVRRMAADLDLGVDVIGAPTLRDPDGLALSSRNVYLTPSDRAIAPALHRVMQEAAAAIRSGTDAEAALETARTAIRSAGFVLDYLELRDAADLGMPRPDEPMRLLVAATLGETRLIDNIAV